MVVFNCYRFALEKFGWSTSATDKTLLPVLKRATISLTKQPQMTQYFPPPLTQSFRGAHKSKRMRNVVARLTGQKEIQEERGQSRKRTAKKKEVWGINGNTNHLLILWAISA